MKMDIHTGSVSKQPSTGITGAQNHDVYNVPEDYIHVDTMECRQCGDESVWVNWIEDMDYDVDEEGKSYPVPVLHGDILCNHCGYRWSI